MMDVLVAPWERPYDNDRQQVLFDLDAAQQAGCTHCGHIYHQTVITV